VESGFNPVRCGCGGHIKMSRWNDLYYRIECEKCEIAMFGEVRKGTYNLIRRWNRAMSGKDMNVPGKWIPCSKRLPFWCEHVDDMVLVSYENGSLRFDTCMNGEWVHGNPIAWMQLPEPYRGDHE